MLAASLKMLKSMGFKDKSFLFLCLNSWMKWLTRQLLKTLLLSRAYYDVEGSRKAAVIQTCDIIELHMCAPSLC